MQQIVHALLGLQTIGSFSLFKRIPSEDLEICINKVGPLDFPVEANSVRQLLRVAKRSAFGLGEQTITDTAVRSGWEIRKSRIKLNGRKWSPALRQHLDAIREELGLSASGKLHAKLEKLTIYGPGEFFKTHQDTQKADSMFGTLIVLLPSPFKGGAMRIDRQGNGLEYSGGGDSPDSLGLLAFYADCHHEILPVTQGYRLGLVYQLHYEGAALVAVPGMGSGTVDPTLRNAVHNHFTVVRADPESYRPPSLPEKLVYLLDHQYTPGNLSWAQLRPNDLVRATALRRVADHLELDAYLALADIHEHWECESSYGRRSSWADDGCGEPVDLIELDAVVRHWRALDGQVVDLGDLTATRNEMCGTTQNDALAPFSSEYEGYMGNWGDTLERWYHRAAVVLWPKSRAFAMQVRASPHDALKQLLVAENHDTAFEDKIDQLLDVWETLRFAEPADEDLIVDALKLVARVEDPHFAQHLFDRLCSQPMPDSGIEPLLALAARHGVELGLEILTAWHENLKWRKGAAWRKGHSLAWLKLLVGQDGRIGRALAQGIVDKQWIELAAELKLAGPSRVRSAFLDPRRPLADDVLTLLRACRLTQARKVHRAIVDRLKSVDSPLTVLEATDVVVAYLQDPETHKSDRGLKSVAGMCCKELKASLKRPARAVDNWAIDVAAIRCDCEDCATMTRFLRSRDGTLVWPLAERRRQHIRHELHAIGVPVTYKVKREGSPYKLVLTKTRKLFTVESKRRKLSEAALLEVQSLEA